MTNRVFKIVVTLVVVLTILLNISCTRENRLKERKAGLPTYFRSSLPRNRKKEESSQSLQRLLRILQKNLDSVQVQVDRINKENKSGFLYEIPIMELPVILLISHKFKRR